jgi:DNA-binding NtrC family response regulator
MPPEDSAILYLEDEIIIALDTAQTLRDMGFAEVSVAHNLRKARRLAEATRFDYALLDVNLGDGQLSLDFGRDLMARGVRVIFASGYNRAEMAAEHDGLVFVEKPLTAEVLGRAVAEAG